MSRRYIDPDLWVKAHGCKPLSKLVAVYLQSSSRNAAGIFRVLPDEIAMHTGMKKADVVTAMKDLHQHKVVLWDPGESLVYIPGFAQVQGMNPKVTKSINAELLRLGASPLTSLAAQIPQLKAQDSEGWHRLSIDYREGIIPSNLSVLDLKKEEGESEGEKPKKVPWADQVLNAAREHWPRGEGGKLYRFDRADARRELLKLTERPTPEEVRQGVQRWSTAWRQNGFQHKASTFFKDRLWEQDANGRQPRAKQITARALIQERRSS